MSRISIITPWSGDTGSGPNSLIPDYFAAVQGCEVEVIAVDNASPPATAGALQEMTTHLCGQYIRNDTNLGFAAANNQGYARATGDIILFLNSDIAADPRWLRAVAADVRDGALYGPSMVHQLVAGRWLPYIEGWCVAATRATWERLIEALCSSAFALSLPDATEDELARVRQELREVFGDDRKMVVLPADAETKFIPLSTPGPWDAFSYPSPYWEDNDLCLRALQAGISLIQTAWPVQHKGGRTAGSIARHAESFERNRATFAERAMRAFVNMKPIAETAIQHRYRLAAAQSSDIQHHLPLLYSLARGNVLELGTRTGVSTAALLAGVEARGGHVWSVDIDDCSALYAGHPQWTFVRADSCDVKAVLGREEFPDSLFSRCLPGEPGPIELLLIDTIHTYGHVTGELAAWARFMRPGSTICIHDPETFPGVRRAVTEFCAARGWPVTFVLPCNGMAVIEVPGCCAP